MKLSRDIPPCSSSCALVRHLVFLFRLPLAFVVNSKKNFYSISPMAWAPSSQISQFYVPYEQRKTHNETKKQKASKQKPHKNPPNPQTDKGLPWPPPTPGCPGKQGWHRQKELVPLTFQFGRWHWAGERAAIILSDIRASVSWFWRQDLHTPFALSGCPRDPKDKDLGCVPEPVSLGLGSCLLLPARD